MKATKLYRLYVNGRSTNATTTEGNVNTDDNTPEREWRLTDEDARPRAVRVIRCDRSERVYQSVSAYLAAYDVTQRRGLLLLKDAMRRTA